jgi:biotin operon repressor
MKPQPRGSGCVHCARPDQWGRWSGTIPGGPTLAAELGIDKKTVEAALRLLEVEGLLIRQGTGRPRRIELPANHAPPQMRVGLLSFDAESLGQLFMTDLQHRLGEAGHLPFLPGKNLLDLGMDPVRVARMIRRTDADAWVVTRIVRWANKVACGRDDRVQSFTKAEFIEGGTLGPAPRPAGR